MQDCVFCKIKSGEIPKEFTYQDEDVMVFPDISPMKPIHLLIIPKKHIKDMLAVEDMVLFSKIGVTVQRMVRQFSLDGKGYRVVTNGGGAQVIDHLHFHLIGPLGNKVTMS